MDEKEMMPGTRPEESAAAQQAAEETGAEVTVEYSAEISLTLGDEEPDEEIDEETAEVLAEQDSLDGEIEETDWEEDEEQLPSPDPLEVALSAAAESEAITAEEADSVRTRISELGLALEKAKGTVKKLAITAGCLTAALVLSLSAVGAFWYKDLAAQPFTGLTVGKSYTSNITLPDYTTVTYEDTYVAPTEKEIKTEIRSALDEAEKTVKVTDALKADDTAVIDFTGYIDDEKYDDACGTDQELWLGSGQFIPGFEDGLIGKKVGDTVTLNLTFPDDYSEESLQGKAVKFEVTVDSAVRYPELTDALVKEITDGEYATVAAYKDSVYEELDTTKKSEAEEAAKNDVWTAVAEGTTLKKYPQNMYDYYENKLDEQYSSYYSSYGVSDLEGFMKAMNMDLDTYVKNQIVYEFSIYTIAAKQGITLSDEDFSTMLTTYGCSTKQELAEKLGVEVFELEASLLYDKVSDYLMEVATAK